MAQDAIVLALRVMRTLPYARAAQSAAGLLVAL